MNIVALIPARAGSQRIRGKNVRPLGGVPLVVWTLAVVRRSAVFSRIIVSTDDPVAMDLAQQWGVEVQARPADQADHGAADIAWVGPLLSTVKAEAFAILRPTSPFRSVPMIQRALQQFTHAEADSLRAVQPVREHPGKMWKWRGRGYPMTPLLDATRADGVPWHSCPTQTLPVYYVQNASLEMAWTYIVRTTGTIAGKKVVPFFTDGYEGFDLNTEEEWRDAERLLAGGFIDITPPILGAA